jgi:recombination protein RecT
MTSTAVAKMGPTQMVTAYTDDFAAVLPSHIKSATWVRLAVGALRRDEKLRQAAETNPTSLMVALLEAARKGLEPGTTEFYLTPRKMKKAPFLEVLGITGYQGEIEMIYRAGAVSSVIVEVVREKDSFTYAPGRDERPVHLIDWDADDRGGLRLAYSYAIMRDGATSKVVVLNRQAIDAAKRYSQGASSEYSPWVNHEESMWLKTAAHRLAKWVPTSAEYRREQLRAVGEIAGSRPELPAMSAAEPQPVTDEDEVVEGELIDEPDLHANCSSCGAADGGRHDEGCEK